MSKEVYFSVAEQEIMDWMIRQVGTSRIDAYEAMIGQKRELAYTHMRRGNVALQRQILQEINEWDEAMEEDYRNQEQINPANKKIILL